MAYTVVRTDRMAGTDQRADLRSLRVYKNDEFVEVENGVVVSLGALEEGKREVYKAEVGLKEGATQVLVASVEEFGCVCNNNPHDYINAKGHICRGYVLRQGDMFGVTKEAFAAAAPKVGDKLTVDANGKFATGEGSEGFICDAIERQGMYTYYVLRLEKDIQPK